MREMELPDWIKERILQKVSNKSLALTAFNYIRLVEREDGTLMVKENFDRMEDHALLFMVLACVNYAQRLLKGEDID